MQKRDFSINKIGNLSISKTPGSDGLTKVFYGTVSNELKETFMSSLNRNKLFASQRQAVTKLIEKNKTKRLIRNQRPI